MGSDNRIAAKHSRMDTFKRITNRRWFYPKRFHFAQSLRCVIQLLLIAVAVHTSVWLFTGIETRSHDSLQILNVTGAAREVCQRKVYNVNSTCNQQYCYVVAVTVNMGFYDFFLNWYHYYNQSVILSTNINGTSKPSVLVVIAEDDEIYEAMTKLSLNNTEVIRGAFQRAYGKAEDYDSTGYKSLVSARASHLLNLLCGLQDMQSASDFAETENRWIVVYSDIDTVWLQDPLPLIQANLFGSRQELQYDILASVDDHDERYENYYCTGFFIAVATQISIYFLSRWEEKLKSNPQLNQPVFNALLHSDEQYPIRHAGLDETQFPPGRLFFNETYSKAKKLRGTVVVHNNYIIGRQNKKFRFQEYGLWNASGSIE
jgi:hypothetical protein